MGVSVRCKNIMEKATYITWFYFTRAVFERHKLLYTMLLALKIQMKAGEVKGEEFNMLLKGGAALDLKGQKRKPGDWLPDNAWLQLCQLRAFREDRTLVVAKEYIASAIGKKYLVFPPLDIEGVWAESTTHIPLIFLLSPGSSPDDAINLMAKRKKIRVDAISMGQGQEIKAAELMKAAVVNGSWVLLQNTHLGLGYMRTLEGYINSMEEVEPNFRLWITSEPHPKFPIGLLQMSIKMTDEPPSGMKAGLRKSYSGFLNQDWLEAVNRDEWKPMLFALCFMHSIVQERRKFGPLGFCVPYEFNGTDLEASAMYMRNHMTEVEMKKGQPSWLAVVYMVCDVQYGGRITDGLDAVLFKTYGNQMLTPRIFEATFEFAPGYKCMKFGNLTQYHDEIDTMKDEDHPNVFGMHANADL